MNPASVLFLGKAEDPLCIKALEFCQTHFAHVTSALGKWKDPLPPAATQWEGDYIISYLSRWVVPDFLLKRARKAAINFHPASPDYPGIGCNNFALYENAPEYGVTCHHMAPKVDTGSIIAVRRFPLTPDDSVQSVLDKTYEIQFQLFQEIAQLMAEGKDLPVSKETWTRPPFTRKQFDDLGRITAEMSPDEIARRVRATWFPPWKPRVEIGKYVFELKELP
jgi:methionyl-tRNA formyltransferase